MPCVIAVGVGFCLVPVVFGVVSRLTRYADYGDARKGCHTVRYWRF